MPGDEDTIVLVTIAPNDFVQLHPSIGGSLRTKS